MSSENWKSDPLENTPPVRGSGNFLKDRSYAKPAETRIKFSLASAIRASKEARKLTVSDVVRIVNDYDLGAEIDHNEVSRILNGNVSGYSDSRLISILAALGHDVSIVIGPAHEGHGHIFIQI